LNVNSATGSSNFTSRNFDNYILDIQNLLIETDTGFTTISDPSGQPVVRQQFDAAIRAFPGRQTTVPVFLDDAMIRPDDTNSSVIFDAAAFRRSNYDPDRNRLESFLGDYVQFDISGVGTRPALRSGGVATAVYFTGDHIALSRALPGPFEVLVPEANTVVEGLGGRFSSLAQFGSYALTQVDPSDVNQRAKIVSIQGIWRPYTQVISNMSETGFEIIAFPDRFDSGLHDLALIRRQSGRITDFYFGVLNLTNRTNSGLPPNRFRAWPIRNIVLTNPANLANQINGSVSNLKTKASGGDSAPVALEGLYSIAATNRPAGFSATGRFIVFRR
jgi:hypothetical protein